MISSSIRNHILLGHIVLRVREAGLYYRIFSSKFLPRQYFNISNYYYLFSKNLNKLYFDIFFLWCCICIVFHKEPTTRPQEPTTRPQEATTTTRATTTTTRATTTTTISITV